MTAIPPPNADAATTNATAPPNTAAAAAVLIVPAFVVAAIAPPAVIITNVAPTAVSGKQDCKNATPACTANVDIIAIATITNVTTTRDRLQVSLLRAMTRAE